MPDTLADAITGILNEPEPSGPSASSSTAPPVEGPKGPEAAPKAPEAAPPKEVEPLPKAPEEVKKPETREPEVGEPETPIPEGEFDAEVGPPRLVEYEGKKEWHYPEAKARLLNELAREARQFHEVVESPEAARQLVEQALELSAMQEYYQSNEPAKVDEFLSYWGRRSPETLVTIARRLAERARLENVPAYEAMGTTIIGDLRDLFYQEYAALPDKTGEDAERYLFGAQILDWFLGGTFKAPDQIQPIDPVQQRLTEVEQRERGLRAEMSRRSEAAWGGWRDQTDAEVRKGVFAIVDQALEPIAALKGQFVYKAARNELAQAIREAVSQDRIFIQRFGIRYDQSRRTRSAEDRKALVDMYSARARRAIALVKAKVITEASQAAVQQSQDIHARQEVAQRRTDLSPGGPAKSPQVVNPKYAKAKEEKDLEGMVKALVG